jgi:hypothetical protein
MKLTRMLQELYLDQLAETPSSDSRRTLACLMHAEIQDVALQPNVATASQLAHIIECSVCRKNWQTFKKLNRLPVPVVAPEPRSSLEVSPPLWSSEFSAHVSRILASASYLIEESAAPAPAHFDGEGTLRVHWSGLLEDGPVSVSILIDDEPFYLASGVVQNGFLNIIEPLAALEQRNIELPAGLLVLNPLGR